MGSIIEINDTLKISNGRGFPKDLRLEKYVDDPSEVANLFLGKEFEFWNNDERLYHRPPTPVFLVEEINGKWLYWGRAEVREQTIRRGMTSGNYRIIQLFDPEFQKQATIELSPRGKSYFDETSGSYFLT